MSELLIILPDECIIPTPEHNTGHVVCTRVGHPTVNSECLTTDWVRHVTMLDDQPDTIHP